MADEKAIALDKLARALNKLRDTGLPLNDWQAGKKYKVNYPVLYENKIYRCIEAHTASSTFDETKWETVSNADSGLKTWVENTLYKTGDIVVYGNGIYQCITEHTSTSTFDTANWTNLSVGYDKKTLYTSNAYNITSTTITTSESMLNKDFIIIKIAYSEDGTSVKMNKSYVLAPVVGEVHDFSYQESTTSYIALTGKILDNTTLQFNFTEAQNITKFKIISIDSLSIGDKAGTTLYSDTPIGTIISYMGNNPPKDYLSCDGTVYNINDYQALADFINTEFGSYDFFGGDGTTTFAVPDLRGEFLRGTGTNSHTNQGSGANVGVHQDGTEHINIMVTDGNTFGIPGRPDTNIYNDKADSEIDGSKSQNKYAGLSDGSGTYQDYQKFTSHPTNTSVLYCIKYTNSNSPEKIDIWTANTSYSVGNMVVKDNNIYRCNTNHISTTFTSDVSKWTLIGGGSSIGGCSSSFELADNDTVNCGSLVRFNASPIMDEFNELTWDFSSAAIDNTQTKYEDNSLLCNSTSTCYCICNDLLTQLFTSGFTIDFWAYITSTSSGGPVYIGAMDGVDQYQILDMYRVTDIYTQHMLRGNISYSSNEWQYWSLNFYNNKLYIFIDGKLVLSCDCPYNSNSSNGTYINAGRTSGRYFDGYISDFKITKNVKHTKINFTNPIDAPKNTVSYKFLTNGIYWNTIDDLVILSKNDSSIFSDLNFIKLSD